MSWLLGGRWSPIGWSVGFVEADLTTVVDTLLRWRQSLGHDLRVDRELARYPAPALGPCHGPPTSRRGRRVTGVAG